MPAAAVIIKKQTFRGLVTTSLIPVLYRSIVSLQSYILFWNYSLLNNSLRLCFCICCIQSNTASWLPEFESIFIWFFALLLFWFLLYFFRCCCCLLHFLRSLYSIIILFLYRHWCLKCGVKVLINDKSISLLLSKFGISFCPHIRTPIVHVYEV